MLTVITLLSFTPLRSANTLISSSGVRRVRSYLNNSCQESCGCHHAQGFVTGLREEGARKIIRGERSQYQAATVEWVQPQDIDHQSTHKEEGACERGCLGRR